ncbi:hypothetical protein [Chroococcidiopsis sp.]
MTIIAVAVSCRDRSE